MLRALTNLLHGVGPRVDRFRREHPGEAVLAAGATKAVETGGPAELARGPHWTHAVRGVLVATPGALHLLPADEVASAVLVRLAGIGGALGQVLRVTTADGRHFQFGLMRDAAWERGLPFPVTHAAEPLRWSAYSVRSRLLLAAALAALVWMRCTG